ncbi:MAG: hypothetical protein AB1716_01390 [Planctomycetota bacterium]
MRETVSVFAIAAIGVLLGGCAPAADRIALDEALRHAPRDKSEELRASLFPGDQFVMSNDTIEQILDSRLVLPERARIAIIRVGPQRWGFWSEDLARLDEGNTERFLHTLRSCPRVAKAHIVPSILTPPRITVPLLREAAARTQSDLVLLYQASSHSYNRTRAFAADETRAYCVVEAFLLDARTGVIPFTSVKTETYAAKKERGDIDFAETIQKSEMTATGRALDRVAGEMVDFLNHLEKREEAAAQTGEGK